MFNFINNYIYRFSNTKAQTSTTPSNTNNLESSASSTSPAKGPPLSEDELREHEETKSKLAALRDEMAAIKSDSDQLASLMPDIIEALSFDSSNANEQQLRVRSVKLQVLLAKVIELLKTKSEGCTTLEKQNLALTLQTKSLKDVVAITKDLLGIRNMEVEHLQVDIKKLEVQINNEKERHNNMLNKMGDVLKLNQSLKTEYETQLGLFEDLKGKYEEKVTLLQRENKRLKDLTSASTEGSSTSKENVNTDSVSQRQEENTEKSESLELNNSAGSTEKNAQTQNDVVDITVVSKSESSNSTETETPIKTVDVVAEDDQVPTKQEINEDNIINTAAPTESEDGEITPTVDIRPTL